MPGCWTFSFRCFAVACVAWLAGAMVGCAPKSEVVPSSGPRQPTSAGMVKLYEKPPKKYEILGTVTASREEGAKWDKHSNADAAFDTAIRKAAALGANGLLLTAIPGETDSRATAAYKGTFYQVPTKGNPPTAVFQAIYVHEE